ncbi:hypothetical protein CPC698_0819A, partial [Chlamydia psittaci C6/98]
MLTRYLCCST